MTENIITQNIMAKSITTIKERRGDIMVMIKKLAEEYGVTVEEMLELLNSAEYFGDDYE